MRPRVLLLLVAGLVLAAGPAAAHLVEGDATDLPRAEAVGQTITFRIVVHPDAGMGVIVSTKNATEAGVRFDNASANFTVLEGPADEFLSNTSRIARSTGDVLLEFRDLDGEEQTFHLEIRLADLNTSGAWVDGVVEHSFAAFDQDFNSHGSLVVPFHLDGDPSLGPTTETTASPALPAVLTALAGALFVRRRR